MRIYHASLWLDVLKRYFQLFQEPLNVLLSVALLGGDTQGFLIDNRNMVDSLIGDSGAWSVFAGKSTLTLEALINYLKRWGHLFDLYFNFDTTFEGDFKDNMLNQLEMESHGLTPVPVIHDFFGNEIPDYVNSGKYPWLALGSKQCKNFTDFQYAVKRIKKINPDIKIHWFGGSRFEWLVKTPVASCDTTFWATKGKFGDIFYWNENKGGLYKGDRIGVGSYVKHGKADDNTYDLTTYPEKAALKNYLRNTFNFGYRDLWGHDSATNVQLVNLRYFQDVQRRVNELRVKMGVPLE